MTDLFSRLEDQYPNAPGARGGDTSEAAAADIAPRVGRLQSLVLVALGDLGEYGATSDELADRLRIPRDSIQPRTSELRHMRKIGDSGKRRPNGNGKRVIVWVLHEHLNDVARAA